MYGHQDGNMFDEVQVPKPIGPYGTKYGCEMDIQIVVNNMDWIGVLSDYTMYMESNKTFGISTEMY